MADLRVRTVTGADVEPWLDAVARLRLEVFAEFPYLYDGDLGYEAEYLATYARSPESLFVLATDGDDVVGASTGIPLNHEEAALRAPVERAGIDPASVFYFGESVLRGTYRGRGLGHRFFDEREAYARRLGRFERTAFCAVERADDHPSRPVDYVPLHGFWRRRGYQHHPDIRAELSWKEHGEHQASSKVLSFWLRSLAAR